MDGQTAFEQKTTGDAESAQIAAGAVRAFGDDLRQLVQHRELFEHPVRAVAGDLAVAALGLQIESHPAAAADCRWAASRQKKRDLRIRCPQHSADRRSGCDGKAGSRPRGNAGSILAPVAKIMAFNCVRACLRLICAVKVNLGAVGLRRRWG